MRPAVGIAFATLLACASPPLLAQTYPAKPVRLIVGYPTGGVNDILARAIGDPLAAALGQSMIVDNRPGANSSIGADLVAKAAPDGHTLFVTGTPFTINASLYQKLPYDTLRDFAPITQLATGTFLLVVHPALPVKSAKELIALAKRRPGELNFCSAGQGAPPHLMGELFKLQTGIAMSHVPYKGAAPCVVDLLGGHIQVTFEAMAPLLPHVKAGKLRNLAVMSDQRSSVLPDIPTIEESTGIAGLSAGTWYGVVAPAATPRPVVNRLNAALVQVMNDPRMRRRLVDQGLDPVTGSPEDLAALLKAEVAKWARVIKAAQVTVQ
jgi:tripartite-type tricarboxylate transporter receptor subunit TctC